MSGRIDKLNAQAISWPAPRADRAAQEAPAIDTPRDRKYSSIAEDEITKLVHRVFILPGAAKAPQVVAFCGVDEGAGCSWVCARTSEALASQTGGTVCAVDANLRSPSLDAHFRIEGGAGFANAMKGSQTTSELARNVLPDKLWVLPAGAESESSGHLNPDRLRQKFSQLRDDFDYILIDTPPAESSADALLLGQVADGVVLVVGSDLTRRESARIAKESFEGAGIPVIGAVLNKRTYPIPEALYRIL